MANQIVAIGEAFDDRATLKLIDNLRISRRVVGVDKIIRGDPANSLRDAIAITVVNVAHRAAVK